MKYIEYFNESMVDKKIDLLKDLSYNLTDEGLEVNVCNGSSVPGLITYYLGLDTEKYRKYIIVLIKDNNKIFDVNLYKTDIIQEFIKTLESYGMYPRQISSGDHFSIFLFDKWGHMTKSTYLYNK